jgi:RNA recognition motif-containing protein
MSKELYVGKMSYDTTEYDLEKLFSVSGRVTSVHLIVDLTTGEFKGCGYVRMSSEAEAKDAIDCLDGAILLDHKITVSLARAQKMKATGGGLRGRFKGKPGGSDNQGPIVGAARPAAAKKPASQKTADYKAGAAKAAADRPATSRPAASKPGPARTGSSKPAGTQARTSRTGKR